MHDLHPVDREKRGKNKNRVNDVTDHLEIRTDILNADMTALTG